MRRNQSTSYRLLLDLPLGGPAHQRIAQAVRTAIREGRLVPGEALPASRQLAGDLQLSRWTVNEAYQQLVAEGYLVARSGSGTFVARTFEGAAAAVPPGSSPAALAPEAPPGVLDLRPGRPDLALFPRSWWAKTYASVVRAEASSSLGYPSPLGAERLRVVVAGYLRRVRGIDSDASRVIVTRGTSHGMSLILRALSGGDRSQLAVEDPGWTELSDLAVRHGWAVEPIPVDQYGIVVDRLPATARAALVTPAHQFPTGTALSAARRSALLSWAAAADAIVVEDDYDAEFRYDRKPVGALAGLDPNRVAYLGSVSKTLAPALRLGWLIPPPSLHNAVRAVVTHDPGGGALEQLALAEFLEAGYYDRHLRRMRRQYRTRREALADVLRRHAPQVPVSGVAAGLHLLLQMPNLLAETMVGMRLEEQGILTTPLSRYRRQSGECGLVISFAHLPPQHATKVVRLLTSALEEAAASTHAADT